MGFIELFFKKDSKELTSKDIENFIKRNIEENLNLDYKDIDAFHDFNELSKDISSFVNSEGGLIILGVREGKIGEGEDIKIFPEEITWGDESLSKEKLEDNLVGKIRPRIDGLRIVPVRNEDGRVIFLLDIPQGINPPYMASDYRYYKRLNFRRVPMEHYEVADHFGRRKKPLLTLIPILENVEIRNNSYRCKLSLGLLNKGKAVARYTLFTASFFNVKITEYQQFTRIDHLRKGLPSIQFSLNLGVIHPSPKAISHMGSTVLEVQDTSKTVSMEYEINAEDMPVVRGEISFSANILKELKDEISKGREIILEKEETTESI
jgi:hypothetical protein